MITSLHRPLAAAAMVTAALTAALVPTASAGVPTVLASTKAGRPTVTAGPAGTFYVAWNDEATRAITVCHVTPQTITKTGVGCARKATLPFSGPSGAATPETPWVIRDPATGAIHVAMQKYLVDTTPTGHHTWLWTSTDDGTTFSGPVAIHQGGVGTEPARPVLGPRPGSIGFASFNPSLFAYSAALDGSGAAAERVALLPTAGTPSSDFGGGTRIAQAGQATVAVSSTATQVTAWGTGPSADLGDPAAWTAPQPIDAGSDATVAGGPGGATLAYLRGADHRLVARTRRADGTWSAATAVNPGEPAVRTYMIDEYAAPAGGLILGYRENSRGLRVSRSADGGATWRTRTVLLADEVLSNLVVARDDEGRGLAVWNRQGEIVASATTEVRDPATPRRRIAIAKDGFTTTLAVEGSCVLPGTKTTLALSGRGKGRIEEVRFSLGKAKDSDDRKGFGATLAIPAGASDGQALTAKAKVVFHPHGAGPSVRRTRTVSTTVDVCGGNR